MIKLTSLLRKKVLDRKRKKSLLVMNSVVTRNGKSCDQVLKIFVQCVGKRKWC